MNRDHFTAMKRTLKTLFPDATEDELKDKARLCALAWFKTHPIAGYTAEAATEKALKDWDSYD